VGPARGRARPAQRGLTGQPRGFRLLCGPVGRQIAEVYAYRGETDKAFEWLERAYAQRDPGLAGIKGDPLLKNLAADSRYTAFLKNEDVLAPVTRP
jgi:hypothetical protein